MAALAHKSVAGLSSRARVSSRSRAATRIVCAAGRPTWLPNLTPPAHLDGSMAGDFGMRTDATTPGLAFASVRGA